MLILIFIFMTPKSWFVNGERQRRWGHQNGAVSTVIVGAELIDKASVREQLEQRVRALSGQAKAKILAVRPRQDSAGNTVAYEVDIR